WQNIQYGPMLSAATSGCTWAEDGVINKISRNAALKTSIVRSEYFSLAGKRLEFKNGVLSVARNTIVVNRTVDARGGMHSVMLVAR
ncbi:MAG: hypothetical protein PHC61_00150, partial [Chitinivibrionales bacterium]|nr:hypothetical protein [Chitinivibrionales bacterium]